MLPDGAQNAFLAHPCGPPLYGWLAGGWLAGWLVAGWLAAWLAGWLAAIWADSGRKTIEKHWNYKEIEGSAPQTSKKPILWETAVPQTLKKSMFLDVFRKKTSKKMELLHI